MPDATTTIRLRIAPGSARSGVAGRYADGWKLRIAAPASDGRANRELEAYLARLMDVPRSQVRILTGASGRDKLIELRGVDPARAEAALATAAREKEGRP